jgi:hypothetical protein
MSPKAHGTWVFHRLFHHLQTSCGRRRGSGATLHACLWADLGPLHTSLPVSNQLTCRRRRWAHRHRRCAAGVQGRLRWECDRSTADRISCFNRHHAEHCAPACSRALLPSLPRPRARTVQFAETFLNLRVAPRPQPDTSRPPASCARPRPKRRPGGATRSPSPTASAAARSSSRRVRSHRPQSHWCTALYISLAIMYV